MRSRKARIRIGGQALTVADMDVYHQLLNEVLESGECYVDRTGVGTRSLWGRQYRVDLADGFPLLTTKKLHWKSICVELEWFLAGSTDNRFLQERGVKIWNDWSDEAHTSKFGREENDLGPVYGHQWRNFGATQNTDGTFRDDGFDQIAHIVETIRTEPNSRRLILNAWNPVEALQVTLPPCHCLAQFSVRPSGRLDLHLFQRSCDLFLGAPFNLASYALLLAVVAKVTDLEPGEFVHSISDLHLYENHLEQARLQVSRVVRPLPTLTIDDSVQEIDDFEADAVSVDGYDPHPHIAAPVAV